MKFILALAASAAAMQTTSVASENYSKDKEAVVENQHGRRVIVSEEIPAAIADVWHAWTTEEGVKTFFAPDANISFDIWGDYEIYFNPHMPIGQQGSNGSKVLAISEPRFLNFSWNNQVRLKSIRNHSAVVSIYLDPITENSTYVTIIHSGFGPGAQWDESYEFFSGAWRIAITHLKQRFASGPLDWSVDEPEAARTE